MIRRVAAARQIHLGKPRASGDDPLALLAAHIVSP